MSTKQLFISQQFNLKSMICICGFRDCHMLDFAKNRATKRRMEKSRLKIEM